MNYNISKYKGIVFFICLLTTSCIGYRKTLYFQGDQQTLQAPNTNATYQLRKGDILQIKIISPDTESSKVLTNESGQGTSVLQPYFNNYYINDSGYVELSIIGDVKIIGYTIMEVDSILTVQSKKYFNYASVDVKFASFKFLALGEFTSPGQYFTGNETCTIYEAIGIAGDAGQYANKQKVQLIRTLNDGSKKVYHMDLTDYSTFTSDSYFIQPNDIIYIQPQKAKTDKQNVAYVSLAISIFTVFTLIITRF